MAAARDLREASRQRRRGHLFSVCANRNMRYHAFSCCANPVLIIIALGAGYWRSSEVKTRY